MVCRICRRHAELQEVIRQGKQNTQGKHICESENGMPKSTSGMPTSRGTIQLLPVVTRETVWRDSRSMRCDLRVFLEILLP